MPPPQQQPELRGPLPPPPLMASLDLYQQQQTVPYAQQGEELGAWGGPHVSGTAVGERGTRPFGLLGLFRPF